jgi:subtilisin-like proprotein convertase family protein
MMRLRSAFTRPARARTVRRFILLLLAAAVGGCAEGENWLPDVRVDLPIEEAVLEDFIPSDGEDDAPVADGEGDGGQETADDLDAAAEDGVEAVEDTPVDDLLMDPDVPFDEPPDIPTDPDVDPEPELPWGVTVCGVPASVPDCTLLCLTPATWSDSVILPALGPGKVIELAIDIQGRYILGMMQPFYDLEVSLTSPSGTKRTFWDRFYGGNSWDSTYAFTGSWQIPAWWDQDFSGTWTLEIKDYMLTGLLTGLATNVRSWCVTPPDPALFSTADTGAHLRSCFTASHAITDYCQGDSPDSCSTHPVTAEHQVTELIKSSGTPTLTVDITHPDVSELRIDLKAASGREMTVWNRSAGPLPASFTLTLLGGEWMTGRWALTVTDSSQGNTGVLGGWCLEAN